MEGESAVEQALSFDFNYDHLLNNQNLQASPIEIVGDFSNELQFKGELGSSCGSNELIMNQQNNNIKQNLTASTNFNGELLELAEDNVASLMETPQNIWDNGMGIISPWMNQDQPHSMPSITPLRSQQLPNQLQLNNEVPAMTNHVFEPQFDHYSMPVVGPSMHTGSQQFPYQNNQVSLTPEVYQPPQGCETMMPQQTLRVQELPNHHTVPDISNFNSPNYNSISNSRFDQLDDGNYHQQINPIQTRHNIFDLQNCNNSRPETNQHQGLPYQNGRGSDLIDTYQQNPFFNSETHQNFLGQKRRFEVGESSYLSSSSSSSSSSKRFRFDELAWKNQVDWNPDSQGISNFSNFSNSRAIKCSVYDPLFEGIGLPIDPHLRMFALRY